MRERREGPFGDILPGGEEGSPSVRGSHMTCRAQPAMCGHEKITFGLALMAAIGTDSYLLIRYRAHR